MNKINNVFCEDPNQKMWNLFIFFECEPTVKNYLLSRYSNSFANEKNRFAFENTSKFIYFIKQAKGYFFSANKSDILVKPLLIYYGMVSLIKALILTKDPSYPNRASVLQHGLSTRKLKKINFRLVDDEIKVQKDGLLPIFYNLITNGSINDGTKFKIKELLSLIPEIHDCYYKLYNEKNIFQLHIETPKNTQIELTIDKNVLMSFDNNIDNFLGVLNDYTKTGSHFNVKESRNLNELVLTWKKNINNPLAYENFFDHPLIIQDLKGDYYLRHIKDNRLLLPEIIIEFLIMYSLGILCRYDTELWGEIIFSFSSEDIYIINEFIDLTIRKFPNLILNNLFEEYIILKEK